MLYDVWMHLILTKVIGMIPHGAVALRIRRTSYRKFREKAIPHALDFSASTLSPCNATHGSLKSRGMAR